MPHHLHQETESGPPFYRIFSREQGFGLCPELSVLAEIVHLYRFRREALSDVACTVAFECSTRTSLLGDINEHAGVGHLSAT